MVWVNTFRLWKRAEAKRQAWASAHKAKASRAAKATRLLRAAKARLMPKPDESLTEWMERALVLPKSVTTESGRVRLYAYQRGIAEAISDPSIERVSIIKSARTGLTTLIVGAVGYRADRSGGNMLLVQPTVDDAAGFGRDQLVPIIRSSPTLNQLFPQERSRDKSQTLRRKEYRGGVLYLVGANSGTGFRRILAPWILLDEVDAYPPSAGDDGDPVKLAEQRGVTAWDRKVVAVSTPLVAKHSRIEALYRQGDQRRFYVPCPECGHQDYLVFRKREDEPGHVMEWPPGQPENAYFVCGSGNGCVIEERYKSAMVEAGEWRATNPDASGEHASFHVWAGYSPHPKSRWGMIAAEFLEALEAGENQLKVFVNTVLGETWEESGDAPDWERLSARRESYQIGTVPDEVVVITCGIDVAPVRKRIDYEVVGWSRDKQSWSIEAGEIYGSTGDPETWAKVDQLIGRQWPRSDGTTMVIRRTAIDSGAATQDVYNWARRYGEDAVRTVKGKNSPMSIMSAGRPVDVTVHGKVLKGGHRNFIVGVDVVKKELFAWLRLDRPEAGAGFPAGWCHFPEYDDEFFRQLTAEHMVTEVDSKGFPRMVWKKLPGRENHKLDCRVYARAAVASLGLDRIPGGSARPSKSPAASKGVTNRDSDKKKKPAWLSRGRGRSGKRGRGRWLS